MQKVLLTVRIVAALLGLSQVAPAFAAARIEPANSEFTAKGPISFAKSIINADCTIEVSGRISADGSYVSVEKVGFDGGLKCGQVEATHLPWKLIAKDETSGAMSGIQVTVHAPLVGGDCGPTTAEGTWSNSTGKLQAANVALDGGCTIKTVSIQMPPTFRVVP
ncbi:protein activator of alkane oxidation PraA [Pseudomonas gingeri NCPPB 3146 = LMG 5327]|uniref:Protein activator of alkane oxidation PraA n=2 Tax=Pseudomonas gingeri TaxID=117681 RepID=A0A7Y7XX33_9PSED|nr:MULTISPECIES: alkane oxidation protein activator PraA [Pseudomonas]NVZ24209.1 protein activator of alkane oxidation PraA [Pseudomonas gingeri]NVZ66749.1 protein activator of alkane oxidation PraA [Pseudomonas gingeri]NVZ75428.1 protein activator of alkane oxidation PraA [Pseudomonas gingeri]NWC13714.1 protein activator of alkane oxidation PraA [Pseudomonas gingeri]NWE68545.1 protein activator of alkane oxidation PraA [Pseudomonas gingeri]